MFIHLKAYVYSLACIVGVACIMDFSFVISI